MEFKIGDTLVKCYENGQIDKIDQRTKQWKTLDPKNDTCGYKIIHIEKKMYKAHRLIWKAFHNEWDLQSPLQIDHINQIRHDNRIENLRLATHQQNQWNNNAKGYSYIKTRNQYQGQIRVNSKLFSSKYFDTEQEARDWYLDKKTTLHHLPPLA